MCCIQQTDITALQPQSSSTAHYLSDSYPAEFLYWKLSASTIDHVIVGLDKKTLRGNVLKLNRPNLALEDGPRTSW